MIQLLRRSPRCPDTGDVTAYVTDSGDVMDGLLREAGLGRLGGPLVVRRGSDWARLDRWRKQAGGEVAVIVQDEELLAEAIGRSQASLVAAVVLVRARDGARIVCWRRWVSLISLRLLPVRWLMGRSGTGPFL